MNRCHVIFCLAAVASCAPVSVAPPPASVSSRPPPPSPPSGSLQEARAKCDAKYPALVGNYLAHTTCINAAIEHYALPTAPHPDLVQLQEEIRRTLSEKIDYGLRSPKAGESKMKEADALIAQIEQDREAGIEAAADRRLIRLRQFLE